jgi:hypothetical protein
VGGGNIAAAAISVAIALDKKPQARYPVLVLYTGEKKMPKSIFVNPADVRKPQILKIKDIPVNQ